MNAAAARTKFRHEMTALPRWEMTKIPRWKITKIPRCNISIFSQWEISPSKHNTLEGGNTNREPPTSCISSEGFGFEAYKPASVDFDPRNDISSVGKMIYISSINIYIYTRGEQQRKIPMVGTYANVYNTKCRRLSTNEQECPISELKDITKMFSEIYIYVDRFVFPWKIVQELSFVTFSGSADSNYSIATKSK